MSQNLILASASPFRRLLLENAGVDFRVVPASIDERGLEAELEESRTSGEGVADALAQAKALSVSADWPDHIVIGSDQTLSLEGRLFHKPASMAAAADHLRDLSGRTHRLNSAIALACNGEILWTHLSIATLTIRPLSEGFIARHLQRAGEKVLGSVGAYQLEGEGVNLFERIEGDYFTILGLPLLPLLGQLRKMGVIDE